jgi:hypothetical protein
MQQEVFARSAFFRNRRYPPVRTFGCLKYLAGIRREETRRLNGHGALLALKVVLLEVLGVGGREFAEDVPFRGLDFVSVNVIHSFQRLVDLLV